MPWTSRKAQVPIIQPDTSDPELAMRTPRYMKEHGRKLPVLAEPVEIPVMMREA
jgi:hypothetical protein